MSTATTAEPADLSWKAGALCAQVDPDLWFPDKGQPSAPAKRLCLECPVREVCLRYALEHDERFGIWGGLSERERRRLRPPRPVARPVAPVPAKPREVSLYAVDCDCGCGRRLSPSARKYHRHKKAAEAIAA
jgi:WhiB family transcriptional regulator, redox-sensing transcriptional regulator